MDQEVARSNLHLDYAWIGSRDDSALQGDHRELLKSKIHRAIVTKVDLHYEGSLGVDRTLMEAAGILPYEAVHVWNVSNGQRLQTYAAIVRMSRAPSAST